MERKWHLIDANNQILGRLAVHTAILLMGKNKPEYAPYKDVGDFVVVINAQGIKLSRNKKEKKIYYYHTSYPGSLQRVDYKKKLVQTPEWIIYHAVRGMLPKNKLRKKALKRLKIFKDKEHPYQNKAFLTLDKSDAKNQ